MLAHVMRAGGLRPMVNQEGSNQRPGLATTMVAEAAVTGHLPADGQAIGLFEVDEGSLPDEARYSEIASAKLAARFFRQYPGSRRDTPISPKRSSTLILRKLIAMS